MKPWGKYGRVSWFNRRNKNDTEGLKNSGETNCGRGTRIKWEENGGEKNKSIHLTIDHGSGTDAVSLNMVEVERSYCGHPYSIALLL